MKKRTKNPEHRNPVAQHAPKFNRSLTFQDRKTYRRHEKHKSREFPASCLSRREVMERETHASYGSGFWARTCVLGRF